MRSVAGRYSEHLGENKRVREEVRVVEERLCDHQRGTENGAARVCDEEGASHGDEADIRRWGNLNFLGRIDVTEGAPRRAGGFLDPLHLVFGLFLPPVDEEPTGALGKILANEEDDQTENGSREERNPPGVRGGEIVHDEQRYDGPEKGPSPVGAVDGDVDLAPVFCRDELVDGGVSVRSPPKR